MASQNWYEAAFRFLGGKPDNYLVIDTETNGAQPNSDCTLVTQFGFTLVENSQVVASDGFLLNWALPDSNVDPGWFRQSLIDTATAMAKKGKPYQTSWERIEREGNDPFEMLEEARAILIEAAAGDYAIVGHNVYAYDLPVLERHFRYLDRPYKIPADRVIDTGLMEKARQMGWTPPHPGECPRADWYHEVRNTFSRVKWSLDSHCAAAYNLLDDQLDSTMAHDAAVDCLLTHRLLEKMAERAREPVAV